MLVPLEAKYWPLIREECGPLLMEDTKGIVAVNKKDEILGAMIFDTWTHTCVNVHILVRNPIILRHGFIEEGYKYVFGTCERKMVVGVTPTNREKALKFVRHLGWQEIYRLKDGFAEGVDLVYTCFTREEWLAKKAA
jgi:hypothetical protein